MLLFCSSSEEPDDITNTGLDLIIGDDVNVWNDEKWCIRLLDINIIHSNNL
jgi:hypothetical protein